MDEVTSSVEKTSLNCKSIFTIISILSDHLWHNYQSYENIILLSNNRNNASLGNHGNWNNGWHASGNNQMFLIARENENLNVRVNPL